MRARRNSPDAEAQAAGRASTAFAWSFTNTVVARFGTLAIGVALARLLGPEEFGTFAVAFIALLAVLSFNELGVSLAIVRWTDDPRAIAPTVTSVSLLMSAVITAGMLLAAGPFAAAMGDPDAAGMVQALSLCVLLNGAVATPAALLQRYFRQDRRMISDQVNVWVGAAVSLGLAVSGAGAWSLVIGRLAGALTSGVLLVAYSPLPYRLGIDRRYVRPLLRFGAPLAGASLIVFAIGFVDQLAVGHLLGPVVLGYYVLAFNLSSWPVSIFSQPLRSVAPAMFARLQHDPAAMTATFHHLLRPLAAVALPSCMVLAATAPDLIRFVYGPEWAPAATALRWLCLLAALRIFFELTYDYLVVLRRSRSILAIQLVWLVVLVPAVIAGVELTGAGGAALAVAAVAAVVVLPLYLRTLAEVGIDLRAVWRHSAWALTATTVLGIVLVATSVVLGTFLTLAAAGLLGAAVVGALLWHERSTLAILRSRPTAAIS
ncbi:lipopolysaccharide biosynthesis protein [Aeromicrobium wangtongii]|uniref:lipopolysaccharide biosynthesis protein n=1 Tax=Aeromicrobium wangtongii TaxID=2969247 RepID=UPI002017A5BC|nr:lipopolysaccharide biosynthesis protein [Aeromicrobium wangtongii]MCL3817856.1 lipopolysaccharide biosynthesis protein [Aeromicrobium wangtongii]